ncbi:hypothetical protein [Larkinella soli]|uniref:hypothetical protein n=1 Tax=Larkinella soli TaxID=1770527 RepID=UPI000FFBF037|nr:hypothetical protein [Larkinella soli]
MKSILRVTYSLCLFLVLMVSLTSCEVIGDIFEAGAWTGGILVVALIALVIWVVSRLFGGRRQ